MNWIKLEEKQPDYNEALLVFRSNAGIGEGYLDGNGRFYANCWGAKTVEIDKVTHWIYLKSISKPVEPK